MSRTAYPKNPGASIPEVKVTGRKLSTKGPHRDVKPVEVTAMKIRAAGPIRDTRTDAGTKVYQKNGWLKGR